MCVCTEGGILQIDCCMFTYEHQSTFMYYSCLKSSPDIFSSD